MSYTSFDILQIALIFLHFFRCAEYTNIPKECALVADDRDPLCCKVPQCNIPPQYNNQTGYVPIPTAQPGILTGGSVTKAPTPGTTQVPIPGQPNPTPGPTPAPRGKDQFIFR